MVFVFCVYKFYFLCCVYLELVCFFFCMLLSCLLFVGNVGKVVVIVVLMVEYRGYEDIGIVLYIGQFISFVDFVMCFEIIYGVVGVFVMKVFDFVVVVDFVVFEDGEFGFFVFVFDFFGGGVDFFFVFFGIIMKVEYQVEGRFFLDVVVVQGVVIFQLFVSEDQVLLIWGNVFFVLDF